MCALVATPSGAASQPVDTTDAIVPDAQVVCCSVHCALSLQNQSNEKVIFFVLAGVLRLQAIDSPDEPTTQVEDDDADFTYGDKLDGEDPVEMDSDEDYTPTASFNQADFQSSMDDVMAAMAAQQDIGGGVGQNYLSDDSGDAYVALDTGNNNGDVDGGAPRHTGAGGDVNEAEVADESEYTPTASFHADGDDRSALSDGRGPMEHQKEDADSSADGYSPTASFHADADEQRSASDESNSNHNHGMDLEKALAHSTDDDEFTPTGGFNADNEPKRSSVTDDDEPASSAAAPAPAPAPAPARAPAPAPAPAQVDGQGLREALATTLEECEDSRDMEALAAALARVPAGATDNDAYVVVSSWSCCCCVVAGVCLWCLVMRLTRFFCRANNTCRFLAALVEDAEELMEELREENGVTGPIPTPEIPKTPIGELHKRTLSSSSKASSRGNRSDHEDDISVVPITDLHRSRSASNASSRGFRSNPHSSSDDDSDGDIDPVVVRTMLW